MKQAANFLIFHIIVSVAMIDVNLLLGRLHTYSKYEPIIIIKMEWCGISNNPSFLRPSLVIKILFLHLLLKKLNYRNFCGLHQNI